MRTTHAEYDLPLITCNVKHPERDSPYPRAAHNLRRFVDGAMLMLPSLFHRPMPCVGRGALSNVDCVLMELLLTRLGWPFSVAPLVSRKA